jgi:Sel1 repeat
VVRKTRALRTLDAHRFGGTSGTSLSQPPLTVPGAESTLNWSRISRLEPPCSEQEETTKTDSSISKGPTDTLFEIPSPERSDPDACQEDLASTQVDTHAKSIAATDDPTHLAGAVAPQEDASPTDALTGREFIPEISLSEYIAHFHYEPPSQPQEVTMRGDAAPAEPITSIAELETPLPVKTAAAAPAIVADADVQVQPDAAPVGSRELPSDSSRPPVVEESPEKKADPLPSALPGPSSLGLSDSSEITEPFEAAADSSRKRPTWIVVGIVVAVALLGAIQWQRQARHTNSGAAAILNRQAQNADPNKATSWLDNTQQSGALKQPLATDKENTAPAETPKAPAALNEDRTSLTIPAPIREKLSSPSVNATAVNPNAASHRKSTANGNPDAPVELANRYIMGKGVPRSCEKAVLLLQSAAAKANVRACNRLASMYAIGSCVPRDRIQAYRWLGSALAADPHNEWALVNRDLTLHQMTAEERSQVENKPLVQRPRRPED